MNDGAPQKPYPDVPPQPSFPESEARVVGTLVLDGDHVDAVAVRRARRGRGIGTALVEAAVDRRGRLTADFDSCVRPFYESLGFEVERREGRLWGELR